MAVTVAAIEVLDVNPSHRRGDHLYSNEKIDQAATLLPEDELQPYGVGVVKRRLPAPLIAPVVIGPLICTLLGFEFCGEVALGSAELLLALLTSTTHGLKDSGGSHIVSIRC
jgi:hypothetical protein